MNIMIKCPVCWHISDIDLTEVSDNEEQKALFGQKECLDSVERENPFEFGKSVVAAALEYRRQESGITKSDWRGDLNHDHYLVKAFDLKVVETTNDPGLHIEYGASNKSEGQQVTSRLKKQLEVIFGFKFNIVDYMYYESSSSVVANLVVCF